MPRTNMIWLVGARGMLGQLVAEELAANGIPFEATGREIDVTDYSAIRSQTQRFRPTWLINCSAYTAVDRAETDVEAAWRLNRDGAANLARRCAGIGARMLHISTDYVFDGEQHRGYAEDDPSNPQSVYGASKAAGEQAVSDALEEHVTVRTSWMYAEHGHNFLLTVLRLLDERETLTVVCDQHGCPTYARDLARALVSIVTHPRPVFGTYHFANAGVTSWYDFARSIQIAALRKGLIRQQKQIVPISTDQYPTAAHRPRYTALLCNRINQAYGIEPRPWQPALDDCLERIARSR